ncbi:MAG: IPTL-CTERM sorting domain-containing protein [Usitatibacter sp.]
MSLRARFASAAAVFALLLSGAASAQTLYVATGSNGVAGQLFSVDPTTATATLVGPILEGASPISITGMAFAGGTMYAVSGGSPTDARSLFTINLQTGAATRIGAAGVLLASDLSFGPGGLFAWQQGGANVLSRVNTATGVPTPLGAAGLGGTTGGGLAINSAGTAYVSVTGGNGTLDTVNTTTGAGTAGPAITGATFTNSMNAMAFRGATLFAVNSNNGGTALTNLVTINTTTGAVTVIGALPNNTDAMAFGALPGGIPTLSDWSLILMALLLATLGSATLASRKP